MASSSVVPLSEYTTALKKWWPVIAGATLVGAVLGLAFLGLQEGEFVSESRVEVRALVVAGDDPNLDITRQVSTTNERIIASSERIAGRALALIEASETLGVEDLDDPAVKEAATAVVVPIDDVELAGEQITVSVPSDSQILVFAVASARAERSRDLANAAAHAYLDFRRDSGLSTTEESRGQLLAREAQLIADLDLIAEEIGAAGGDDVAIQALEFRILARTQELQGIGLKLGDLPADDETREELLAREMQVVADLALLAEEIGAARGDEVAIRALEFQTLSKTQELQGIGLKLANVNAIGIDPGVVLDTAVLPESESGFPAPLGLVSGALVGLLAGVGLAFRLDRGDDRFRDTSTELSSMGVPLLGEVPVGGGLFRRDSESGIAELNSDSDEAYRRVQGSLLFSLDQSDKSVVLVAGTNNPQSATTVAANLAASAARSGRRTLLVGADIRRPSLHERFDLPNEVGLSDVLSGNAHFAGSLQSVAGIANLRLLSAGSPVDQPARLLQGEGLGRLVSAVRSEFDLVIFEAPPVMQNADAVDLARLCEGTVIVIEPSRATRGGVEESIEQLRRVGADVIGMIVAESS